jgi:NAD(P)-dependent dehydrogenase (short-subunit alcohol dehydrogenase family)
MAGRDTHGGPGPLHERIGVVTGGAGAIGTSIITALRGTGHRTVVLDREGDVACDLSSEASTRAAAAAVLERYGRCDVFVHCAAAFDQVTLSDVDAATWRHVQSVNVESALWLAQAFTPGMTERRFGRIVFIISDTFWAPPNPALLAYVASKGALVGIMRTLAATLGTDGIAVSAVAPGLTDTPGSRTVNSDEQFDATVDRQALKRRLTPDDTAATVTYLASDAAAAMTGQVLCPDGGLIMR